MKIRNCSLLKAQLTLVARYQNYKKRQMLFMSLIFLSLIERQCR